MGLTKTIKKNKWIAKLIFNINWTDKKAVILGFKNAKQYYEVPNSNTNMKDLLKCTLCPNMCRFECPVLQVTMKEMYAPATKARISYHMERGDTPMDDLHTAEVAYMCVNCNGCQNWCPMDISTGDLLRGVRADLISQGIYIPKVKEFNERLSENKTAFTPKTFTNDDTLNVNMENPDVFYYMGCVTAEKKPEAAQATIEILKKAGVKFCTHADIRECCGTPAYTLGFLDTFKIFAQRNLELFKKSGIKTIISDCPACATAFSKAYKSVGLKCDYNVKTTAQFFKILIEEGKIKPTKKVDFSITYHDPCYTARGFEKEEHSDNGDLHMESRYKKDRNFIDSARWVFKQIPGLILKDVFLHGQQTQCCGRGGVCHIHHPEISDEIGRKRVKQLQNTGADKIISSCPSCEEGLISNGAGECLDIAEVLLKSLD